MGKEKTPKGRCTIARLRRVSILTSITGCYNCMKRRIKCDRTEPQCEKCLKKELECPGYGIRYRFAKPSPSKTKAKIAKPAPTSPVITDETPQITQRAGPEDDKSSGGSTVGDAVSSDECAEKEDVTLAYNGECVEEDINQSYNGEFVEFMLDQDAALDGAGLLPRGEIEDLGFGEVMTSDVVLYHDMTWLMPSLEPLDPQTRLLFSHCKPYRPLLIHSATDIHSFQSTNASLQSWLCLMMSPMAIGITSSLSRTTTN